MTILVFTIFTMSAHNAIAVPSLGKPASQQMMVPRCAPPHASAIDGGGFSTPRWVLGLLC